jgi:hypothetical protein
MHHMGAEVTCQACWNGRDARVKARLETDVLRVRSAELKLDLVCRDLSRVGASDGVLSVSNKGGTLTLAIGSAATKWAEKIVHPPSRGDRLGVKPGWRVSVVGEIDRAFTSELKRRVARLSVGRVLERSNAIFFGASREADLDRLGTLATALTPDGALWTIRPKGVPAISERAVRAAGQAAGLVDVKVVRFSETHTAEKFVVPVTLRRPVSASR